MQNIVEDIKGVHPDEHRRIAREIAFDHRHMLEAIHLALIDNDVEIAAVMAV